MAAQGVSDVRVEDESSIFTYGEGGREGTQRNPIHR